MKFPTIKAHILVNIVIVIFSAFISCFTLLFGFAHLFEGVKQIIVGGGSDIPLQESLLGWVFVIMLCIIGIITLVITIASIRGIIYKLKHKK